MEDKYRMSQEHMDLLDGNCKKIAEAILPAIIPIVNGLCAVGCIPKRLKQKILNKPYPLAQADELLEVLKTMGPDAFDHFCQVCQENGVVDCMTFLKPGENCYPKPMGMSGIGDRSLPEDNNSAGNYDGSEERDPPSQASPIVWPSDDDNKKYMEADVNRSSTQVLRRLYNYQQTE